MSRPIYHQLSLVFTKTSQPHHFIIFVLLAIISLDINFGEQQ